MYEWFTPEFKALKLLTVLHNFQYRLGSWAVWEVENRTDGTTHVIRRYPYTEDVLTQEEVEKVAKMRTPEEILTWLREKEMHID